MSTGAGLTPARRRVLLLGATSAIVAGVAHRLAARGDHLFLVGRNPEKLAAVAASLGQAVQGTRVADLTDPSEHEALAAWPFEGGARLDIVLIGHGDLGDQAQSEHDPDHARALFEANLLSVVGLLIPLANRLEAQGSGTIAVITTVASDRGRPRNYTYGAAKAGLDTYLEGLRSRLWRRGVRVLTLKPGPIDTPMTAGHPRNPLFATVDDIAPRIVTALDRGWAVTYLPAYWRPIMAIVRALPERIFQNFAILSGR